jgi:hypothetical protein
MRFGKKLAIMAEAGVSKSQHKPFISHREIKDILAAIVRCLRSKETDVLLSHLLQFDQFLRKDLVAISRYVGDERARLSAELELISKEGLELGFVDNGVTLEMIHSMQNVCN